jgi:Cu/Ag efflux protein CusF
MRLWKVVVLVDVALALGLGLGYLRWGLAPGRPAAPEAAAPPDAAALPEGGAWRVRGVVRAVLPASGALLLTHEVIPGVMPGMTMVFPAEDPSVLAGLEPGDEVRFTVREKDRRLVLVAVERLARP